MVCTGRPSAAAFSKSPYNLFARSVDGRGRTGSEPCLDATCAAVYGRLRDANRCWLKNASMSATRALNAACSSASVGGVSGRNGSELMAREPTGRKRRVEVRKAVRRIIIRFAAVLPDPEKKLREMVVESECSYIHVTYVLSPRSPLRIPAISERSRIPIQRLFIRHAQANFTVRCAKYHCKRVSKLLAVLTASLYDNKLPSNQQLAPHIAFPLLELWKCTWY